MLRSNPPSLRNFAVLKLERRNALGRFYSVRDRRLNAPQQTLFVPSRLRAWPRHLAQLSNLDSTPVRLRDGRVALLIGSNFNMTSIQSALKSAKQIRATFDAISGFQHGTIKRRRPLLISTFCSGLVCLLFIPQTFATPEVRTKQVVVKVEPKRSICSTALKAGERVELLANRNAESNGIKYKVQGKSNLGGLVQLHLVRVCDKSKWKVTAWKTGKVYQIDSVG
ncbi:MAG: hypothetical protein EBU12_08045 [Microbacteriaceae bacterium]|nr:hypothetical protein [Microbacteriaceae bacterium]